MIMKAMLLAGTMLVMMGAANAADITAHNLADIGAKTHANDPSLRDLDARLWTIDIVGEIQPGDDEKFRRVIGTLRNPLSVDVYLESPGGDIAAGLNIGEQIRAHEFSTSVIYECASVCGLMWLAGTPRSFHDNSRVGFHAAYYSSNGKVS